MQGYTEQEIFLNQLGRNSFLRFWSWPSLFRDQGDSSRKGDGKEICDLTVVFGEHVIFFSDKKVSFNTEIPLNVAWSRWARKAIRGSLDQLRGAKRWFSTYPDRVFIDKKCTKPVPVKIPNAQDIKFHSVVVCHGLEDILILKNDEASFFLDNSVSGDQHWEQEACTPFSIGKISADEFVHVFNESTIDLVLREFDTAHDFISYLTQRESLLNSAKHVTAVSEADIIHLYYRSYDEATGQRIIMTDELKSATGIFLDLGGIRQLYESEKFVIRHVLNRSSYFWDDLVGAFSHHILNGTVQGSSASAIDLEPGVRVLAATSRFERRVLSDSFLKFYYKLLPGQRATRIFMQPQNSNNAFLFFALPYMADAVSYERYREVRVSLLSSYAKIMKHLHPHLEKIISIGFRTRSDEQISENFFNEGQDFALLEAENWTEDDFLEAKETYEDFISRQLFATRHEYRDFTHEFPDMSKASPRPHAKGRHRNSLCECGSGKKVKKCCASS